MKENRRKIVALAKEKNFSPTFVDPIQATDFWWFLWICNLQRWLREDKLLYVYCVPNETVLDAWHYKIEVFHTSNDELSRHFLSYDEALEEGLFEALKTI